MSTSPFLTPEDELLPLEALTIGIQQQGRQTFDVRCTADIFYLQAAKHWIGLRENLQETRGFYHEIWGFPVNFPPIQWHRHQERARSGLFNEPVDVPCWNPVADFSKTPSNCRVDVSDLRLHIYSLAGDTVLSIPDTRIIHPHQLHLPPGHFQVTKTLPLMLAVGPVDLGIQLCQMTLHMVRLVEVHQLLTCTMPNQLLVLRAFKIAQEIRRAITFLEPQVYHSTACGGSHTWGHPEIVGLCWFIMENATLERMMTGGTPMTMETTTKKVVTDVVVTVSKRPAPTLVEAKCKRVPLHPAAHRCVDQSSIFQQHGQLAAASRHTWTSEISHRTWTSVFFFWW